jgi:ABC-2 type transport system permease protein
MQNMRHDLRMYWLSWRVQFKAQAALRAAFMVQIVGMMLNNIGLMAAWLFLFERFGTINGWDTADFIGVQGINMVIFGITILFSAGLPELPRYIDQGAFDTFLTKPSSILLQIMSSRIEIATMGDVLLGVGLIVWYIFAAGVSGLAIAMFLCAVVIGIILMWCFTLLPFLLAFYLFDSNKTARNIAFFYLDVGIYPTGVLSGGLRTFFLTAFPGMFIGVVPLEVLRDMRWEYLALGFVVASAWLVVSLWLFRRSLKRYESANLVGAR